MSEYLRNKIEDALWDAKAITFPHAPELECFARGVEHAWFTALMFANDDQRTNCAGCGVFKNTPLRRDDMGGYVCLSCIDKRLNALIENQAM